NVICSFCTSGYSPSSCFSQEMEKRSAPPVRMRPAHRTKLMNERTLTSNLAITQSKLTAALRSSKSQFPSTSSGPVETANPKGRPKFRPPGSTTGRGRAKNNTTGKGVLVIGVYAAFWLNNYQRLQGVLQHTNGAR